MAETFGTKRLSSVGRLPEETRAYLDEVKRAERNADRSWDGMWRWLLMALFVVPIAIIIITIKESHWITYPMAFLFVLPCAAFLHQSRQRAVQRELSRLRDSPR